MPKPLFERRSLERNRILRVGAGIMPPEGMDDEDYKSLLEQLEVKPKPVKLDATAKQYYDKIKKNHKIVYCFILQKRKEKNTKQFYLEYLA